MGFNSLNTELERNTLIKDAGKYFVDKTSDVIKDLNLQGESALLGIQSKKGLYTIIGKEYVYYLASSGKKDKMSHKEFSEELHENACRIGKGWLQHQFMYKNIVLKNSDDVWLYNAKTMSSLWSIIAWLQRNKWDPYLKDIWVALGG